MLDITDYVLTGQCQDRELLYPLQRYRPSAGVFATGRRESLALVLVHGVSLHKETWIPVVEHLFAMQAAAASDTSTLVEAWAIDLATHGRAGILNEQVLLERPDIFTGGPSAEMMQTLLRSGLISAKNICIVGHSGGGTVAALSTVGYPLHNLPYTSMILIEPVMMNRSVYAAIATEPPRLAAIMQATKTRKDIWPSRAAACEWLSRRQPWKRWHPRILELFAESALRDLPTATYPDRSDGVTLSCTRVQEAFGYSRFPDTVDGLERLNELCAVIPVHCIYGTAADVLSDSMQQSVFDVCKEKPLATITILENAGHFAGQEDPQRLAATIWGALKQEPRAAQCKL
ncbi:alpha/beta-hydrolase [Artomyces pyxidatus]|uniref:Alpha/beta-hydrolase n=1 Tax=Artomyces pyxidatus TaxID=48021 RepID=A0ACB8SZY0_9AGAM|nr:alpha/beta-hydrolase [Artomyces pyxidatus]